MLLTLRLLPMLLVMGVIFFFSHQPGDTLRMPSITGIDKVIHMAVYALLALSVLWFLGSKEQAPVVRTAIRTLLVCLLYGISDEWHQSMIPHRVASVHDLLADMAGALLVVAIWLRSKAFRAGLRACHAVIALKLRRCEGAGSCSEGGA